MLFFMPSRLSLFSCRGLLRPPSCSLVFQPLTPFRRNIQSSLVELEHLIGDYQSPSDEPSRTRSYRFFEGFNSWLFSTQPSPPDLFQSFLLILESPCFQLAPLSAQVAQVATISRLSYFSTMSFQRAEHMINSFKGPLTGTHDALKGLACLVIQALTLRLNPDVPHFGQQIQVWPPLGHQRLLSQHLFGLLQIISSNLSTTLRDVLRLPAPSATSLPGPSMPLTQHCCLLALIDLALHWTRRLVPLSRPDPGCPPAARNLKARNILQRLMDGVLPALCTTIEAIASMQARHLPAAPMAEGDGQPGSCSPWTVAPRLWGMSPAPAHQHWRQMAWTAASGLGRLLQPNPPRQHPRGLVDPPPQALYEPPRVPVVPPGASQAPADQVAIARQLTADPGAATRWFLCTPEALHQAAASAAGILARSATGALDPLLAWALVEPCDEALLAAVCLSPSMLRGYLETLLAAVALHTDPESPGHLLQWRLTALRGLGWFVELHLRVASSVGPFDASDHQTLLRAIAEAVVGAGVPAVLDTGEGVPDRIPDLYRMVVAAFQTLVMQWGLNPAEVPPPRLPSQYRPQLATG
ncbi:hypothetical protein PAPYR_6158 [Paratrimastix pyriformis]|uniref:Uncharacterized protein n=1 Tax=Paratrimastix pyriformis TaxID=342808 RepID=A0ABQ8UL35_9EUKA|nr:hypothetical protein PAPYR_6158 [Paratrimastix pyriformis]